jgi:hypothetical protein
MTKTLEGKRPCHGAAPLSCKTAKQTIPKNVLNSLYAQWIKNPLYRMKQPGGRCYQRAYLLAKELSQSGFAPKILEIGAPVVLGLELGEDGLPNGKYNPYDEHFVVAIDVESEGGVQRMILDPQFMNEARPVEDYLRQVTDLSCSETRSSEGASLVALQTHQCVFQVHAGNWSLNSNQVPSDCAWDDAEKFRSEILEYNQHPAGVERPISLAGSGVRDNSYGDYRTQAMKASYLKMLEKYQSMLSFIQRRPETEQTVQELESAIETAKKIIGRYSKND